MLTPLCFNSHWLLITIQLRRGKVFPLLRKWTYRKAITDVAVKEKCNTFFFSLWKCCWEPRVISKSNVKVLKSAGINSNIKSYFRKIEFTLRSEMAMNIILRFKIRAVRACERCWRVQSLNPLEMIFNRRQEIFFG